MFAAYFRLRLSGAVAVGGLLCAPSAAQAPVDPRMNMAVQQSGRMLDANPGFGTSGLNASGVNRPLSPLVGGNAAASGLATGGFSLRSYSPIPYASEFRASLGSARLSDFRRDSVSVATPGLGQVPLGGAYFDPARTAPTAGFLREAEIKTGTPSAIAPLDLRLQPLTPAPSRPGTRLSGLTNVPPTANPAAPPQALGPPTLNSSLFGVQPPTPPRLPLPVDTATNWPGIRSPADRAQAQPPPALPQDIAAAPPVEGYEGSLGAALRPELYPRLGLITPEEVPAAAARPALRVPERVVPEPGPRRVDPSLLPGFDVLTDMQLALAQLAEPDAPWLREMQAMLRENPELARQVDQRAAASVNEYLQQALETPLRSFAAPGATELNDQLLKAESLMDIGRFGEAADRYERAALIDPDNPLPLLGKANALLAQGQYASAAGTLQRAIELADRQPGLAAALLRRLDLTELMGGGETIDMRRSDLMRQLERAEDPNLRFLLGFLEYHTGNTQRGLDNLRRAAAHPLASAILARYPALLTGQAPLPAVPPPAPAENAAPAATDPAAPQRE